MAAMATRPCLSSQARYLAREPSFWLRPSGSQMPPVSVSALCVVCVREREGEQTCEQAAVRADGRVLLSQSSHDRSIARARDAPDHVRDGGLDHAAGPAELGGGGNEGLGAEEASQREGGDGLHGRVLGW